MTGFAGLAPCVHCGFCLQSCPTYLVTGDEADSPRGRIVLMQRLAGGELPADDPGLQRHLDRCLGCRGCEPVCPSGVRYGPALEAARERMDAVRPVGPAARVLLAVMSSPSLRAPLLAAARALRPAAGRLAGWSRLGFAAGMLAGTRPAGTMGAAGMAGATSPTRPTKPSRPTRPAVIFLGCIQRDLFGHVNAAAARTLRANEYTLDEAPAQGCCGALHAHAGLLDDARALARANLRAFADLPDAYIVSTAAGCGAMLRSYGELLAGDPAAAAADAFASRVRDVTEVLSEAGPRPGGALPLRVAYDPPCHLVHAQHVADPPRAVLAAAPGVSIVAHDEADLCCGSAGLYSLLQPTLSHSVLRRKLAALDAVAPDLVVTGNPGCAMQLAAGLRASGRRTPVAHPVEVLDASYRAGGIYHGERTAMGVA